MIAGEARYFYWSRNNATWYQLDSKATWKAKHIIA